MQTLVDDLTPLVGQRVVMDTSGTMVYLGTLAGVSPAGFWLTEADVHDCRDGHAAPEVYILHAATEGITANRNRVFVLRSAVLSVSALQDVVADFASLKGVSE